MKPPAWIAQLARNGSTAFSQVSQESTQVLEQLCALQLVRVEAQRNRRRVVIRDPVAFAIWVAAAYPSAVATPLPGRRATNIARARQSKAGVATHDVQPLLVRWFSPDPTAPWAELTQRCGIIGVTTEHITALELPERWTLLTVENWEPFVALEYEPQANSIVAIFIGGNIADSTLRVVASLQPPPTQAIHFGDYDWSGLAIFRRIRAMLPMITLYVPDDIVDLFHNFAGHRLLEGQPPLALCQDDPAEVRQVLTLIATHNAGLEQEIVVPPQL